MSKLEPYLVRIISATGIDAIDGIIADAAYDERISDAEYEFIVDASNARFAKIM